MILVYQGPRCPGYRLRHISSGVYIHVWVYPDVSSDWVGKTRTFFNKTKTNFDFNKYHRSFLRFCLFRRFKFQFTLSRYTGILRLLWTKISPETQGWSSGVAREFVTSGPVQLSHASTYRGVQGHAPTVPGKPLLVLWEDFSVFWDVATSWIRCLRFVLNSYRYSKLFC